MSCVEASCSTHSTPPPYVRSLRHNTPLASPRLHPEHAKVATPYKGTSSRVWPPSPFERRARLLEPRPILRIHDEDERIGRLHIMLPQLPYSALPPDIPHDQAVLVVLDLFRDEPDRRDGVDLAAYTRCSPSGVMRQMQRRVLPRAGFVDDSKAPSHTYLSIVGGGSWSCPRCPGPEAPPAWIQCAYTPRRGGPAQGPCHLRPDLAPLQAQRAQRAQCIGAVVDLASEGTDR